MLEDLLKFEDIILFQDQFKPKHEVQNFKTRAYFIIFRYFFNCVSQFSNEEFDSSNYNEIDFEY